MDRILIIKQGTHYLSATSISFTSQTMTVLWPIWAAACRDVIPSLALMLGSAPQSLTRYWTTSRWPSWQAR